MATLSKTVPHERIVLSLFADLKGNPINPVLVFTYGDNKNNVPADVSFYIVYEKQINELAKSRPEIEIKSQSKVRDDLGILEVKGDLISLDKLLETKIGESHQHKKKEYNDIIKSFDPVLDPQSKKFIKDAKRPPSLKRAYRGSIYILRNGNDQTALNFLLQFVNKRIGAITPQVEQEVEAIEEVTLGISKWRLELERFDNQILKSDEFTPYSLFNDIKAFFNECFLRICPNSDCGTLILKPNKNKNADLSENPILNTKEYEELLHWQDLYYMSYEEASNSKEHPFSKLSDQSKQSFKQTLIDIKNEHFTCPHCKKKGVKTFILKQKLLFIDAMLSKILLSIDINMPWIVFGYPGDGKSAICVQFLQYLEWRYSTGFEVFNVDENTTIAKLGGGFSPLSFGGKKIIRYGVITKCALKKGLVSAEGELIGWGKNILLDELNRGESENYAFLMGFFAEPYRYLIEEEGRTIENPNKRPDLYGTRWQLCATMNIQDVGNQPLPLALKRRFFIIRSDYEEDQVEQIIDGVIKLSSYEESILESLMRMTSGWHSHNEIRFPPGIGHYTKFFKSLRSGLQNVDEDLNNKFTKRSLEKFIEDILVATIIMPIVDENRRKVVEGKLKAVKGLASEAYKQIDEYYVANGKDLESLETIIYY